MEFENSLTGVVKTISGQFKKSDLCVEHRLNVRALFKLLSLPIPISPLFPTAS